MSPQVISWSIAGLATLSLPAIAFASGTSLNMSQIGLAAAGVAVLTGLHAIYAVVRPAPVLARVLGVVAALTWSLLTVGLIAVASLGLAAPLIDRELATVDRAMGLDARGFVEWVACYPVLTEFLGVAYLSSVPLVFATAIAAAVMGHDRGAWRFCACVAGSGLVCAWIAAAAPAVGAFVGLELPHDVTARLPAGAGTFYLPIFNAFREGRMTVAGLDTIEGVITFPSFHTVMALATAHAMRDIRFVGYLSACWSLLVLASAIVIGGHYFADLLVGALIWLFFLAATQDRISASWRWRPFARPSRLSPT